MNDSYSFLRLNDVWKTSNGTDWEELTVNTLRQGHRAIAINGSVSILVGGYGTIFSYKNDIFLLDTCPNVCTKDE